MLNSGEGLVEKISSEKRGDLVLMNAKEAVRTCY